MPGKNKKLLGGRELLRYTIEAALESQRVEDWVLTSDDEDILRIGSEYRGIRPLRRPAELCTDTALAIDYVRHALAHSQDCYTHTVICQVTSPFTRGVDIDETFRLLAEDESGASSAVSVREIAFDQHPSKFKILAPDGSLQPYLGAEGGRTAAHQLPRVFVRNGSVYATSLVSIRAGEILGDRSLAYLMPAERSVDINDGLDFAFAEFLLNRQG